MIPAGVAAVESRIAAIRQQVGGVGGGATASGASFDAVLAGALAETAGTGTGVPSTGLTPASPSSARGRITPPAELARYGNGRIPAGALTSIGQSSHRLWAPAADAFNRMAADAAADGVRLRVTDSYRSYDAQVDVARRKGLYSQGGLAAAPGTSSHGWGLSLDVDTDGGALEWLRRNGARYGFVEDVPREPWHWTYRPA